MKKANFSPAALVIGFILGPIIETNVRRALLISRGGFTAVPGPLTVGLLMLSIAMVGFGLSHTLRRSHRAG